MFAYWLVNFLKASKQQKPITTIISQKGISPAGIHYFNSHKGKLIIDINNLFPGGFKRTWDILICRNNFITVSG